MNKRKILAVCAVFLLLFIYKAGPVSASGLKISPLVYRDSLQKNEKQKGHIDISNTGGAEVTVSAHVEGFRQKGQEGALEFFEEPKYTAGITFDYDSFVLGPRETIRLYFLLDANKLPSGGVYAALFFTASQGEGGGSEVSLRPVVRVGSLIIVDNGGGGKTKTSITDARAPFFQFGSSIHAEATVKNESGDGVIAGFPRIASTIHPLGGSREFDGPMVMPGAERKAQIKRSGTFIGLTRLTISDGGSSKRVWVIALTGKSKFFVPLALVLVVAGAVIFRKRLTKKTS
jgi:hypothetical protein